ncbi:MAG: hypothetical protein PHQ23_10520 [Candidatus Wallbacteria bacterium]|nr:hypothetical protein [Candidatus Wallbacteria bacterium]
MHDISGESTFSLTDNPLKSLIDKADTEEDRNRLILQEKSLFYVALTRGRKSVLLIKTESE